MPNRQLALEDCISGTKEKLTGKLCPLFVLGVPAPLQAMPNIPHCVLSFKL